MADPVTKQILDKLNTLLIANVGLDTVEVDGTRIRYKDLEKKRDYWARKYAREQGRKSSVQKISLSGGDL